MKMVVVEIVGDMSITAAHQPLSVVTNKKGQDTVKLAYTHLGVCMIFGGWLVASFCCEFLLFYPT